MLYNLLRLFSQSIFILLLITQPASAEVHKWTDDNGDVHYSQIKPNNTDTETVTPPPKPAVDPEIAAEKLNERVETNRKAEQEKYIADQKEEHLKQREEAQKQNCHAATQNLKLYRSYGRVRVKETDGSYTRLSEEERQQRISDMKEKITEYCDTPLATSESTSVTPTATDTTPTTTTTTATATE